MAGVRPGASATPPKPKKKSGGGHKKPNDEAALQAAAGKRAADAKHWEEVRKLNVANAYLLARGVKSFVKVGSQEDADSTRAAITSGDAAIRITSLLSPGYYRYGDHKDFELLVTQDRDKDGKLIDGKLSITTSPAGTNNSIANSTEGIRRRMLLAAETGASPISLGFPHTQGAYNMYAHKNLDKMLKVAKELKVKVKLEESAEALLSHMKPDDRKKYLAKVEEINAAAYPLEDIAKVANEKSIGECQKELAENKSIDERVKDWEAENPKSPKKPMTKTSEKSTAFKDVVLGDPRLKGADANAVISKEIENLEDQVAKVGKARKELEGAVKAVDKLKTPDAAGNLPVSPDILARAQKRFDVNGDARDKLAAKADGVADDAREKLKIWKDYLQKQEKDLKPGDKMAKEIDKLRKKIDKLEADLPKDSIVDDLKNNFKKPASTTAPGATAAPAAVTPGTPAGGASPAVKVTPATPKLGKPT